MNAAWLVVLVFVPFILGLLAGINWFKQKATEKLLKKMNVNEIEKLLDE